MKNILAIALMAVVLTGCEVRIGYVGPQMGVNPVTRKEYPTVNLPLSLRQSNWTMKKGREEEGSCVHATWVSLLRWNGQPDKAAYWRRTYAGGEIADDSWGSTDNFKAKLDREGVRYAYTTSGDVNFLEWACSTRRGAGVTVIGGKHMVALVHFDNEWAGILDNNDVETIHWIPRETFVAEWQNSNGWAVTPVYSPSPPLTTHEVKE
jgi:hypothetical protein